MRVYAFIALMIVAIGAGIFSGMPLEKNHANHAKRNGEHWVFSIVVALGQCLVKFRNGALGPNWYG